MVAANVLHATADLRQTLENVRALLAPQGTLLLLEATASQPWVDLTFGLTTGWWRFTDLKLRPDYPLISSTAWNALLSQTGFAETADIADGSPQAIIIARAGEAAASPTRQDEVDWLIFADRLGLGADLAAHLKRRGASCRIIRAPAGDFDSASPGDVEELVAGQRPTRGIVHLWGLDADASDPDETTLSQELRHACGSALAVTQWSTAAMLTAKLFLVTRGAISTNSADRSVALTQAPLWGLGRVAALEHPTTFGKLIDLDPAAAATAAADLAAELLTVDDENQVAYRDGVRHVARLTKAEVVPAPLPRCRPSASYLITGGLGGLGLATARWLVEACGARHLVLLGRSQGSPEAAEEVELLRTLGVTIECVAADTADGERMQTLLEALHARRPIAGIVASAGMLDDGLLAGQTWQRFESVFAAKVAGTWNLHRLTRDWPLDFFVMYSSAAAVLGSPGQGNYAAANTFEDALAEYRVARGLPALSIQWGPWSEIGSAVGGKSGGAANWQGLKPLTPQLGLETLAAVWALRRQVAVLPVDWTEFVQQLRCEPPPFLKSVVPSDYDANSHDASRYRDWRARLDESPTRDRLESLREFVREETNLALGHAPSDRLDSRRPLNEIGLDSLMALQLTRGLGRLADRTFAPTLLFNHPTVEALTSFLAAELYPATPMRSAVQTGNDRADDLVELPQTVVDEVRGMSDLELDAELDRYISQPNEES